MLVSQILFTIFILVGLPIFGIVEFKDYTAEYRRLSIGGLVGLGIFALCAIWGNLL